MLLFFCYYAMPVWCHINQSSINRWQEAVRAMENSSYFESLDTKPKGKYCEKLSCVGLSIQDNPNLPKHDARFVNDMAV